MTSTLPPLVQAFSGAFGSAAANASSYPLDLVCTRLQTSDSREPQGLSAILTTLKRVTKKKGLTGLYDGLETDTAATLISSFFYFYAYSFLRDRIFAESSSKITKSLVALEEIAIGFLAGVASRAISTPLSLVTVRLQSEMKSSVDDDRTTESNDSITSVMKQIYQEGGLRGFWRGFPTTTLLCLNPSLTLFLYQAFRRLFLRGKARERPSSRQAFLGAAVSNVIAVSLLYPLILAKTRLQSARRRDPNVTPSSLHREEELESMLDIWKAAYRRDGVMGMYQGLEAQILKGFLSQGVAMMVKQRLEQVVVAVYSYRVRLRKEGGRGIGLFSVWKECIR